MVTWWVQIAESTPIERADEVEQLLNESVGGYAEHTEANWEGNTPEYFSAMGDGLIPLESILPDVQPLLGEHERIILSRTVMRNVIDRSAVEYFIVTRNMTATLSGRALVERAVYLSRIAEEDLEKAQKTFDGEAVDG